MLFNKFLQLPVVLNRLNIRSYYSDHVKAIFLQNINKFISKIESDRNEETSRVALNNSLNEFRHLNESIQDIDKELSNKIELDTELISMMSEEKIQLEVKKTELVSKVLTEIYQYEMQKDSERISDNSNCLFEISSGVGGKEAMLFANELCQMYCNYFNFKNWTLRDVSSDEEGDYLRHFKAQVEGQYVWDHLKYEAGVHRVQRIPKTEARGRIHTSTITVACIPITAEHNINLTDKDVKMETKRASGAGGQHVNKTESAVRLIHIPTGIAVECQEDRSQMRNRDTAFQKLKRILIDHQIKETFEKYLKTKKSQIGQANRNEKIRTYNYNQDRITDHRLSAISTQNQEIEGTIHDLEGFFQNPERLDDFIDSLRKVDRERELVEILEKLNDSDA